jgi:putative glutathione S-transferase
MTRDSATVARERNAEGAFVRQTSAFRDRVTADGSSGYPAVAERYHLYVSLACPWAHRTIVVRELKGLADAIPMTIVDPVRDERGWRFPPEAPDPVNGFRFLSEAYAATDPGFDARVTVPVLWDTVTGRIVNNESADIVEILNSEFDGVAARPQVDLHPGELRDYVDELNAWIYDRINDGVYKAGFASSQAAYEAAVVPLFEALDTLEERLADRRFLFGERQTLADWRLFTTLVRFDAVYVGHFKCNLRRIEDYPNLFGYLRDLHQTAGVAATVDFDHIKRHYYVTHGEINPTGIVPVGPVQDLSTPHERQSR